MAELEIIEHTAYDPELGRYDELLAALRRTDSAEHDPERTQAMIDNELVHFFLGRVGGLTVASTVLIGPLPTTTKVMATIEDVATLPEAQGNGYGRKMMEHAQGAAVELGVDQIQLHSNGTFRPEANNLYRSLGYRIHETNVFVMDL